MARVKEHAKRGAILLAAAGFVILSVGTTFLALSSSKDQTSQQQDLQKQIQEQMKKQQEQAKEMQKMNEPLEGYAAEPFDKASANELQKTVLKEGDGAEASDKSTVKANYFGWTSDGKIFDSSKKQGSDAKPAEFPLSGVIKGWTEGLTGVKAGSVVKLVIPADKAYGAAGSPPTIGANEPLAFIVELVEVK